MWSRRLFQNGRKSRVALTHDAIVSLGNLSCAAVNSGVLAFCSAFITLTLTTTASAIEQPGCCVNKVLGDGIR